MGCAGQKSHSWPGHDETEKYEISSCYSEWTDLKLIYELCISGTFHLIFSDYRWLLVTQMRRMKPMIRENCSVTLVLFICLEAFLISQNTNIYSNLYSSINTYWKIVQFSHSVMSRLIATPQTAAHQASLSITNSRSLLKLTSVESVMPSNYLILCCPLLLPSIFASIRVFSSESVVHIRWPKYF